MPDPGVTEVQVTTSGQVQTATVPLSASPADGGLVRACVCAVTPGALSPSGETSAPIGSHRRGMGAHFPIPYQIAAALVLTAGASLAGDAAPNGKSSFCCITLYFKSL